MKFILCDDFYFIYLFCFYFIAMIHRGIVGVWLTKLINVINLIGKNSKILIK